MSERSAEERWPVAIVGAGAAGLLAAIFAARGGARPLLIETRPAPGAKIRVSGGGRCNLLPSRVELEDYETGGSRRALRNVLFSWPLEEVRAFFERDLGVALKTEATGKVFPQSDDAREVVAALLGECARLGVARRFGFRVARLQRDERGFALEGADGARLRARRVVLATGGLSLPKTGSDGGGFALARSLGHTVAPTFPALVPLRTSDPAWTALAGVSCRARLRAVLADPASGGRVLEERTGDLLFTHRGFSGPVVLDMSHHVTRPADGGARRLLAAFLGEASGVAAAPDREESDETAHAGRAAPASPAPAGPAGADASWDEGLRLGRGTVGGALRRILPRRLADALAARAGVSPERPLAELPRAERLRLTECLEALPLPVAGSEGYRTAEVTGGGVPLAEVSPRTLESRVAPGLYLAGEMLDVFGRIGGYNFLWAWVTGRKVGLAAAAAQAADQGVPSSPLPGT